jgi:hypothetical protein
VGWGCLAAKKATKREATRRQGQPIRSQYGSTRRTTMNSCKSLAASHKVDEVLPTVAKAFGRLYEVSG